jgi:hypothetical protein
MKMLQTILVCFCFLGAAQLASSQTKPASIPGFYNPATGKFTTHIESNAKAQPDASTGTNIFFREQFNITITNYDQPSSYQAVCTVTLASDDEGGYSETAAIPATASGGSWTCVVPILTLWKLQTPTTDSIYASVSVDIYSPTATPVAGYIPVYRESTQSLSLTQPGNAQTIVNNILFQL